MSFSPRVAVVDDETPMRTALGRLLRLGDCEVTLFSSGEAFLASLDAGIPDCVILDIWMAGLSGIDVLRRLRAVGIQVPVICVTASEDVALAKQVLDAGAVQLLRKPIPSGELLDAMRLAIAKKS